MVKLVSSDSTKEEGGAPFKKRAGANTSRSAGFSEIETNGRELTTAEMLSTRARNSSKAKTAVLSDLHSRFPKTAKVWRPRKNETTINSLR